MERGITPPRTRRFSKPLEDSSVIDMVIQEQVKLQVVKDQVAELEKNFTTISKKILNLRRLNTDLAKQNSELKICMKLLKNHIASKDADDPMGNLPTPRTPKSSDSEGSE